MYLLPLYSYFSLMFSDVGDSPPDPVSDLADDSEVDTVQSEDGKFKFILYFI